LHVLGLSNIEIAERIGVSPAMVSYTINSVIGQMKIRELQQKQDNNTVDLGNRLLEAATKGQSYLADIASGVTPVKPELRARVCMDQLSRAGFPAITKSSIELHNSPQLTGEDIAQIMADIQSSRNAAEIISVSNGQSE
jgi:predicted transcriptional regulator